MRAMGWDYEYSLPRSGTGWVHEPVEPRALDVRLDGIMFVPDGHTGGRDAYLTLTRIEGWWEPAPDATDTMDHWSGDGTLALMPRLGGRRIDLRGQIHARSYTQTLEMQAALTRARRGMLTVTERHRGVSTLADVRRLDLSYTRLAPQIVAYELTLVADDPLRYGTATHTLTNGSNQLLNRGDATAFPLLELRGPHNAVTIGHPGGSFSFPALTSSQRRLIDARNGDVWNLANDQRVFVGSGPWPRVEVGGSTWQVSGLGSGTAVVRRFEAWT